MAALLLLFGCCLALAAGEDEGVPRLRPWMRVEENVVPVEVCKQIIEAAERTGIPLEVDSIDYGEPTNKASQVWPLLPSLFFFFFFFFFSCLTPLPPSLHRRWTSSTTTR